MNTSPELAVNSSAKARGGFGGWGWGMIVYSIFMYWFYAGWGADGLNIFTTAFQRTRGWDPATMLTLVAPGLCWAWLALVSLARSLSRRDPDS